ncbi:MAG: class I SAM-dependent methyltransferase [Pseudomonadota bacterium]
MTKKFLDDVYGEDQEPLVAEKLYDAWAASYDQEIAENGYVTPRRCAEALAGLAPDLTAPVLDFGCGTGLSGLALRSAGFSTIDGIDLSAEMLNIARGRQGVYRTLHQVVAEDGLPFAPGTHSHAIAAGVISPDHAPPDMAEQILAHLPPGGILVFSLNDHALKFPEFAGMPAEVAASGKAVLSFEERGPHLPGINLEAVVFGLTKT